MKRVVNPLLSWALNVPPLAHIVQAYGCVDMIKENDSRKTQ